jgi:hypothetical protein
MDIPARCRTCIAEKAPEQRRPEGIQPVDTKDYSKQALRETSRAAFLERNAGFNAWLTRPFGVEPVFFLEVGLVPEEGR